MLTQAILILLALSVISIAFLGYTLFKMARQSAHFKKQMMEAHQQLKKEMENRETVKEKLIDLENKIVNERIDDSLTGLPSRRVFQDRLVQIVSQSQRHHLTFAIMMLEIDGFNVFKNVLGLDASNQLLKEIGARLKSCIRPMDTTCRTEGSEFIFIISQLAKPETAAYVAKRLLEEVARPFLINQREIFLTASIGVSVYPNDGDQPNVLIQHAGEALLQAKSHGNNTYQFYQEEMHTFSQRELLLSSSLHNSDTFREFLIYYQPWIDTNTKKIVCMEAFLQWNHPEFGMIPRQDLLRLVEKSGNVLAIGEWLLRNACQQLQKWLKLGFDPGSIALNVSPRQLENPHFSYQVSKVLQEMKLTPTHLILELSEMLLMNKQEMVDKSLRFFQRLGMQVCMSHFGAGNVSLQQLKGLPIHFLKMDKALISDLSSKLESEAIVKMIIALANTLKVQAVADGVENDKNKQLLKELGCHLMQGEMICPPMAASEFTATVERQIMEQA